MLSPALKRRLRHVILAGLLVAFPLLYLGPLTADSTVLTGLGLGLTGLLSLLALLAF